MKKPKKIQLAVLKKDLINKYCQDLNLNHKELTNLVESFFLDNDEKQIIRHYFEGKNILGICKSFKTESEYQCGVYSYYKVQGFLNRALRSKIPLKLDSYASPKSFNDSRISNLPIYLVKIEHLRIENSFVKNRIIETLKSRSFYYVQQIVDHGVLALHFIEPTDKYVLSAAVNSLIRGLDVLSIDESLKNLLRKNDIYYIESLNQIDLDSLAFLSELELNKLKSALS